MMDMFSAPRFTPRPEIALVDPACKKGYAPEDLDAGAVGGTEATILRISIGLRDTFDVTHYQNGREQVRPSSAGHLRPLRQSGIRSRPQAIIVINAWKVALKLRKQHQQVPIFLWLHVHPGKHNRKMGAALREAGITVICVSRSHAAQFRAFLPDGSLPHIDYIYNPISDDLDADATPRDLNRMIFASAPHKGLRQVYEQFNAVRSYLPDLKLAVADPGYLSWDSGPPPPNVLHLGALPQAKLLSQMRRSLCLFYPQTHFAETFGLVLAEANAVGTPVLVQAGLGANDEVARDHQQTVDGKDIEAMVRRISAWRRDFPDIRAKPEFRLTSVCQDWKRLLDRALAAHDTRSTLRSSIASPPRKVA
jgi:glycosyltransferase involved in cell wall biosynthesis